MTEYKEYKKNGDKVTVCPHCGYVKDSPPKETYHLTPGSILQGKYIVGKAIGYGGFGVTYIGYDAQLERKVAIKEYLPTNFSTRMAGQTNLSIYVGQDGEQFQMGLKSFVEEAKRLSKFNPLPGTVDIYDSFLENKTGYIVMEYLEGRTVKEEMAANGVFEYAAAKLIILKILDTLKEVHKEGIVHRDIAPDNIFLSEGSVRLIDFGASRYAAPLQQKSLSVILKPGYTPTEQYQRHGDQGPWSDVYALAATFYKMITGVTPEESMERMAKDNLKEPSKLGVKLPQSDENAIMNALLVKASDRTQTAEAFKRQLTEGSNVRRAASTVGKYDAGKFPKWAKALVACIGGVIVLLVVLILTGVIPTQNGPFVPSPPLQLAPNETRVPNVVNEQYESAVRITDSAGLLMVVTDKEYSDKVDAGKVTTQAPLSGRVQTKGSALSVVVSGGKETAITKGVMPDVVFHTSETTSAMLSEAGVDYTLSYEESDNVQTGNTIRQSVAAGSSVSTNTSVSIVVSKGSSKQSAATGENAGQAGSSSTTDGPTGPTGSANTDTGSGSDTSESITPPAPVWTVNITKQPVGDTVWLNSSDPLVLKAQLLDEDGNPLPLGDGDITVQWCYSGGGVADIADKVSTTAGMVAEKVLDDGVTYQSTYSTPILPKAGKYEYYAIASGKNAEDVQSDVCTVTAKVKPAPVAPPASGGGGASSSGGGGTSSGSSSGGGDGGSAGGGGTTNPSVAQYSIGTYSIDWDDGVENYHGSMTLYGNYQGHLNQIQGLVSPRGASSPYAADQVMAVAASVAQNAMSQKGISGILVVSFS